MVLCVTKKIVASIALLVVLVWSMMMCNRNEYILSTQPHEVIQRPKTFVNSIGMTMVWIPPGAFIMGRLPDSMTDTHLAKLEHPQRITIDKGFYMAQMETTKKQYSQFHGEISKEVASLPATDVSWTEANAFCAWLSKKDIRKYRLPSTAEWEYACRAGRNTTTRPMEVLADSAWYSDNANGQIHAIGLLKPNEWGLYDMRGNVWEWCADIVPEKILDPTPFKGMKCAFIRGGCYLNGPRSCDCSSAYGCLPVNEKNGRLGFRVLAQ